MLIRNTIFLTILLTISMQLRVDASTKNYYKRITTACNVITEHPNKTVIAIAATTGIAATLLYKRNKAMQNYVRRAHASLLETSDNVYYDVLDKVCMPIMCEWQELAETPFSSKDAAYVAAGLGAFYGIKKANQKYQLAPKVKSAITQHSPLVIRHLGYAKDAMIDACKSLPQKIQTAYSKNRTRAKICAGITALGIVGYFTHQVLASDSSYTKALQVFWKSFTPEQFQQLEQDHLDLMMRAQDNPTELLTCDTFMQLLTEKQKMELEKIILQYTKEIKQFKELM